MLDLITHLVSFICFFLLCVVVDANAASGTGRSVNFERCLITTMSVHLAAWIGLRLLFLFFGLGDTISFPPPLPLESLFMSQTQRPQPQAAHLIMHPAHPMAMQAAMPPMQPAIPGPPLLQPAPAMMPPLQPMQPMQPVQPMQPMQPSIFPGLYKIEKKKEKKTRLSNGQKKFCLKGQNGHPYGVDKNGLPCAKPGPKAKDNKAGKKKPRKKKNFKIRRSSE